MALISQSIGAEKGLEDTLNLALKGKTLSVPSYQFQDLCSCGQFLFVLHPTPKLTSGGLIFWIPGVAHLPSQYGKPQP